MYIYTREERIEAWKKYNTVKKRIGGRGSVIHRGIQRMSGE